MRRSFSSICDVDLLGLGQHQDAGGAGVHPALRLGDRHPLHAVHAALELQQGVRRLAGLGRALGLHRDGHRLVAAEVGLGGVEDLDLPAAGLGVPGVHAEQVAGEQRRLLAALPGLHLEDRVLVVGRVARDQQPAQPLLGLVAAGRPAPRPRRRTPGPRRRARGRRSTSSPSALPVAPGADDRRQRGVALVELLGQPGVGVRLGRGELLLELGVLGEHALDGLEHRLSSLDGDGRTNHERRSPHVAGTGARTTATCSRRLGLVGLLGVAGLEAGDAAAGVEDLLLAGVERVALRADVGVDDAGGRGAAGGERRATGAGHLGVDVVRVDVLLHGVLSSAAGSPRSLRGGVNRSQPTIVARDSTPR